MNQKVLDYVKAYPPGGGYEWDPKTPTTGVSKDLFYKGFKILGKDAKNTTYCTGATFQCWFELFGQFLSVPVSVMREIQRDWYVAAGGRRGPVDALVKRGLGKETVYSLPGTFAQIWRKQGSGHSVIVIERTHEYLKYWSTQPATNGVGERTEYFKGVNNPIVEIYTAEPN